MGENQTGNEQREFLARLVAALQKAGIPYLVTGSVGSSLFGEPRATRDIDFIITPTEARLKAFVQDISSEYYVSPEAALEAFRNQTMFNVINAFTSWKADFIIRKDTAYEREKFQRRIRSVYRGLLIEVASPEDIILSKLSWAKATDSERQVRDAFGVVAVQGEALDKIYLRQWAKELGVEETLEKVLEEAGKVG